MSGEASGNSTGGESLPLSFSKALPLLSLLTPNIAFVVAPLLSAFMLQSMSWRAGLQFLGLIFCTMGCLYVWLGPVIEFKDNRLGPTRLARLLKLSDFWLMVLLFSFAISATLDIYAMLPLYLVTEQGMDQQDGGFFKDQFCLNALDSRLVRRSFWKQCGDADCFAGWLRVDTCFDRFCWRSL